MWHIISQAVGHLWTTTVAATVRFFFLPQTDALLFIVLFTQNAYFIAVGNIIIFNSYCRECKITG